MRGDKVVGELYDELFHNNGGETAPGLAVMQVAGVETIGRREYIQIERPDGDGSDFVINDVIDVADGENGVCCDRGDPYALYDSADGTPAAGEEWGPLSGSWKLRKAGSGFLILGDSDGTKVRVRFLSGTGRATVTGAVAIIKATVSAATIDEPNDEATPGILAADKAAEEGALMMKWSDDGTKYEVDDSLGDDGWVDAVNLAMTAYRASTSAPLLVTGTYQKFTATVSEEEVELERFVINDKDLRSLPGFVKASTEAQVPYHDHNDDDFQLDYDEC